MLDKNLAQLYGVETRVLNQAVKRNAARFPADFMFELTRSEIAGISQIVTSSGLKFSKRVVFFTQEGVAMLSGVLRSAQAVRVNIAIMRAFVRLREATAVSRRLAIKLIEMDRKIASHDHGIRALFDALHNLMNPPQKPRGQIGFHVKEDCGEYKRFNRRSANRDGDDPLVEGLIRTGEWAEGRGGAHKA
jgi:hypothetical protein